MCLRFVLLFSSTYQLLSFSHLSDLSDLSQPLIVSVALAIRKSHRKLIADSIIHSNCDSGAVA